MERREYTRLMVDLAATLHLPGAEPIAGRVGDISFGGAYLDATGSLPARTLPVRHCYLALSLAAKTAEIGCDLVDVAAPRFGLRFTHAASEDYARLRAYLLGVAPDSAALQREVEEIPNPAFAPLVDVPSFQRWIDRLLARRR